MHNGVWTYFSAANRLLPVEPTAGNFCSAPFSICHVIFHTARHWPVLYCAWCSLMYLLGAQMGGVYPVGQGYRVPQVAVVICVGIGGIGCTSTHLRLRLQHALPIPPPNLFHVPACLPLPFAPCPPRSHPLVPHPVCCKLAGWAPHQLVRLHATCCTGRVQPSI
jgi:hypothetical protein